MAVAVSPECGRCFDGHGAHAPHPCKILGFAIAIIFGFGIIAAGLCGYLRLGPLFSHVRQIDAIILMAVGGGIEILLLIMGIASLLTPSQPNHKAQFKLQQDQLLAIGQKAIRDANAAMGIATPSGPPADSQPRR